MTSVYVIAAEGGPVKIGIANNPRVRLAQLGTGTPFRLHLAHVEDPGELAAGEVEKAAHALLGSARTNGEWFAVTVDEARAALCEAIAHLKRKPANSRAFERPLTNAERQQRYRERRKGTSGLSATQVTERAAVMAGPLSPLSSKNERRRFMGLDRQGWRTAPNELVDFFGMREACDRWNAEWVDHLDRVRAAEERAKGILDAGGRRASKIMRERGAAELCAAYDADPTLGATKAGA